MWFITMSPWPLVQIIIYMGIAMNVIMFGLYLYSYIRVKRAKMEYMKKVCVVMMCFNLASIWVFCSDIGLALSPQMYFAINSTTPNIKAPIVS